MRLRTWPSGLDKMIEWTIAPAAHSRGHTGTHGHDSYARGPGARVTGTVTIAPMCLADALQVRGFLHSLRGGYGSFYFLLPITTPDPTQSITKSYTDNTDFSDTTQYADVASTSSVTSQIAASAADTDTLQMMGAGNLLVPGNWIAVGDITSTGQIVQIVSVSGTTVTVRPRLRNAQSSLTTASYGRVYGLFRLAGDVPYVPIIPGRSTSFQVPLEEMY